MQDFGASRPDDRQRLRDNAPTYAIPAVPLGVEPEAARLREEEEQHRSMLLSVCCQPRQIRRLGQ